MQRFKIQKHHFSGTTSATTLVTGAANVAAENYSESNVSQNLQLRNNYYVYASEIGGGTVNDNNVRSFLDDERNSSLAEVFIDYIKKSTSIEEFREIFYNNKKLATVFNEFYKNNILPVPNTETQISATINDTEQLRVNPSNFDSNNERVFNPQTILNAVVKQNNYYVPIYIEQSKKIVEDGNYANYFKDCINSTYIYKRYTFLNLVSNNVTFGNTEYINSVKDTSNFGFSPIEEDLFGNYSVGLPPLIGRDSFMQSYNYAFKTLSQFEYYFKYKHPVITTSFPGFFLSQNAINILNENTISSYAYGGYDESTFVAGFEPHGLTYYDKNYSSTTIPVTVKITNPSVGTTFFTIYSEKYSTATKISDFALNANNPGYDFRQISIQNGLKDVTFPLTIYKNMEADESIILSLRSGSTVIGFLIVKGEESVPVNTYSHNPTLLIEDETKNKLMLRCFVDYNFDDNESFLWHNNYINIINNSTGIPGVIQSAQSTQNELLIAKVASILRIDVKNLKNLFVYGSRLYGTNHSESDFDLIVVADVSKEHQNIFTNEFNIQVYSEAKYLSDLANNNFPAIETLSIPEWAVIKRNLTPSVEISPLRVSQAGIKSAMENLTEAKSSSGKLGQDYMVKKRLFHVFRKLLFTTQLIQFKKIEDFEAANEFRNFVNNLVINSKSDIEQLVQSKFDEKIKEINVLTEKYK